MGNYFSVYWIDVDENVEKHEWFEESDVGENFGKSGFELSRKVVPFTLTRSRQINHCENISHFVMYEMERRSAYYGRSLTQRIEIILGHFDQWVRVYLVQLSQMWVYLSLKCQGITAQWTIMKCVWSDGQIIKFLFSISNYFPSCNWYFLKIMTRKLENNEHHEVNKYVVLGLVCKLWGLSLCYSTAGVLFCHFVDRPSCHDEYCWVGSGLVHMYEFIRLNSLAHSIVLSAWPLDWVYEEGIF